MIAIPNPIASTAAARHSSVVLVGPSTSLTGAQLLESVRERAARLATLGLEPGTRVAMIAPPSVDWVVTWHALGWLGCVVAPLAPIAPVADLVRRLGIFEAHVVLTDRELPAPWAERSAPLCPAVNGDSDAPSDVPERFWPLDEARACVFTSGTSGEPSLVELTTGQLLFSAFGSTIRLGHALDDRWLCCLPLHHVGGISVLMRCAWLGTCVLLHPRFEAERVAQALDAGRATIVSLVPTMLSRVLDARPATPFPESLRAILLGGAEAPQPLLERCRGIGAPVSITWGMSEAASQIATRQPGDLSRDGGCGVPVAFARVETRGDRLTVRGPVVQASPHTTADVGEVDSMGRIHVFGRADDVIVSGGEKLAPREVESVLSEDSRVAEVAVVARPHPRWGQRPVAFVVADAGSALEPELRARCRTRLEAFKVPDTFYFVAELPRTELGKIARQKLREQVLSDDVDVVDARPTFAPTRTETLRRLERSAERAPDAQLPARLADVRHRLSGDLAALDDLLSETSESPDLARQAADHMLSKSGKRIRPICVLLAGRLSAEPLRTEEIESLRALAAVSELVHNATLLHDDVIDQGEQRRGVPTARVLFGNTASVLGGDHLLTSALQLTRRFGSVPVLDELLAVIQEMVAAEALQLERQRTFDVRPDVYLEVAYGKTASLFRWSLRAGAMTAKLPAPLVDSVGEAGRRAGVAFQMIDDVLDLEGDASAIGKEPLANLREGKMTWPLLVAAERDPALTTMLRAYAADPTGQDARRLVSRVVDTGALDATRSAARRHVAAAHGHLERLPETPFRDALRTVIDFIVSRLG